jgi:hypothetical protein|tara:strand:- start:7996 stop:8700 length:705 start_codon:yes stop_codon:yes gene_type:complete
MAITNLNVFDKVLTKSLTDLESKPDETTAETFILKNIDKDKKIVIPFAGTGRAAKLVKNNPDVFAGKDVKFYEQRTGYIKAIKDTYDVDVKYINDINEVQIIKDIDSVIVINEAEKQRDIKQFIQELLEIPAKKYFIVIPNTIANGSDIGVKRIEQVNNTDRKIVNNIFSHKAIIDLAAEFGFNPFVYKQKDNSVPECVMLAKQHNNDAETKAIKANVVDKMLEEKPKKAKAKK